MASLVSALTKQIEIPCAKPESAAHTPQVTTQSNRNTTAGKGEEPDLLYEEELRYLVKSDALRAMLKDPHLRKCLTDIAPGQAYDAKIQEAMGSPVFAAFANEVLTTVGARDKDSGAFVM